ncbi:MAG: dihydrodipicolinate synthase family protein [Thermomicrobiales bacterium]
MQRFRGILPVMATAFTADGALDEAGCRAIVRYNLAAGAHGIVTLGHASEFASLSDRERERVTDITIDEVGGRVPVIIGTAGTSTEVAVEFARYARDAGADGLMVMPPYVTKASGEALFNYYAAIGRAVETPIVVQNAMGPVGTPMAAGLLTRLAREIPTVLYIKEEASASTHTISTVLRDAGDSIEGVLGGESGKYLLMHYARGACGNMPGSAITELYAPVWTALEAGDWDAARAAHNRIFPLLNFFGLHGIEAYKEILHRRGIIASTRTRGTAWTPLDDLDRAELDTLLAEAGLGVLG